MPPVFSLQIHPDHRIDAKDGEAFWEARPSSASSKLLIACMSQHGWDRELALRVLQAYEQLVTLKARLRDWQGTRIQAPPLVLKMWETHQQDVTAYIAFCYYQSKGHVLLSKPDGPAAWKPSIMELQAAFDDSIDEEIWTADKPTTGEVNKSDCKLRESSHTDRPNAAVHSDESRLGQMTRNAVSLAEMTIVEPKAAVSKKRKGSNSKQDTKDDYKIPKKTEPKKKVRTGLNSVVYELSPALSAIVQGRRYLPRTQVTKAIWEYIKQHDLQDPRNGQYILCDKKLQEVLGVKRLHQMHLQTLLTPHYVQKVAEEVYQKEEESQPLFILTKKQDKPGKKY